MVGRNPEAEFNTINELINQQGRYRAARAAKNGNSDGFSLLRFLKVISGPKGYIRFLKVISGPEGYIGILRLF